MSLSDIDQVRLKIYDQPKATAVNLLGAGSGLTVYPLPHRNLSSGTAYVVSGSQYTATGATFNASGWMQFSGQVAAGSGLMARYVFSTFSDAEIQHFLDEGGDVVGAALEAVMTLMFDGLRRSRWTAPDGSSYDDTAAMALLDKLYERLLNLKQLGQTEDLSGVGGFQAWPENQ